MRDMAPKKPGRPIDPPPTPKSGGQNALTSIPRRIHCAATQTQGEDELSEMDRIILDHFFDALAEVAMAIAKRSVNKVQDGDS